jgi:ubiquinone/menaquinone biosynthesis C-methylase UbiE
MSNPKELAFRYDLFITPDWRDRFDTMIDESVQLAVDARILDVNCGTGAHAIELSERMHGKGEVIGIDPSPERVDIARAKALVKKAKDVKFQQGLAWDLPFENHEFDATIGDASLLRSDEIEDVLAEMIRVTRPEGKIILKLATRGSFDEFFSIFWEALHDCGMADQVWTALERLINERRTVSEAELMAERSGLGNIVSFTSKEEFSYENANEFLESPLIVDSFLSGWIEIVPEEDRDAVLSSIASIIERERNNASFDVSIKATVISGIK